MTAARRVACLATSLAAHHSPEAPGPEAVDERPTAVTICFLAHVTLLMC